MQHNGNIFESGFDFLVQYKVYLRYKHCLPNNKQEIPCEHIAGLE